jgi:multidrug efflux pump
LVQGPGAAARNSIGLVLVAGMVLGTAFTLFFVPAIYVLLARDHRHMKQDDLANTLAPQDDAVPPVPSLEAAS